MGLLSGLFRSRTCTLTAPCTGSFILINIAVVFYQRLYTARMIFRPDNIRLFQQKALQWASMFEVCCCLDANRFTDRYTKFDMLIAAGVRDSITAGAGNAFEQLQQFRTRNPGWCTGFLGYDLKNELEELSSGNPDDLHFPDLFFFAPRHLIIIRGQEAEILSDDASVLADISRQLIDTIYDFPDVKISARMSRETYLQKVNQIKQHIGRGDIYVTNFCQEFYATEADINPLMVYRRLNEISPNPFSCFFKYYRQYIIGASPERYLARRGNQLISQPIKGTAARNPADDENIKQQLHRHPKERQENVMIVDLVRNDLTRCAEPGSVTVQELFGIYSFEQVHQMISTVTGTLNRRLTAVDALSATFPMGSMTGAPKLSAMQLMEQYEESRRGIYSGTVGYFDPQDDFDFNVVIRTLLYNAGNRYLSFHTGSAITYDAQAEQEYEECLLKAKAILEALGAAQSFRQS